MSAGGDDTEIHVKEGGSPSPLTEGIPKCSTKDEIVSENVDQNTPSISTLTADILEDVREIEAVLEKKLPTDKEKALDVDSELDFELKWDDEMDLNENQNNDDLNTKDLDSNDAIEKCDLAKETDSAFTSTETDLDRFDKEKTDKTEDDIDSLDKEIESISIEKDLDKETESILNSIEEQLDTPDEGIHQQISEEIAADSNNKEVADADISIAMEVDNVEQPQIKEAEPTNVVKSSEDQLTDAVTANDDVTLNVDNTQEDIDVKSSPADSEANSLDEQLVYSDAEAEDKDLLDEIDATDISDEKTENETAQDDVLTTQKDTMDMDEDLVKSPMAEQSNETPLASSDILTAPKELVERETTEKYETHMDIGAELTKSKTTEKSNETPIVSSDIITAQKESVQSETTKKYETDMDIGAELTKSQATQKSSGTPLVSSDILTAQKESVESGTTEKEETDMDVDPKLIKSQITEQSNETPIVSSDILTAQKESVESGTTEKEETDMDEDLVKSPMEEQSNDTPLASSDILTAQKELVERETTEKYETDMDIGAELTKSKTTEKSNETPIVSSDNITAQKESVQSGTTKKYETDMDIGAKLTQSQTTEKSSGTPIVSSDILTAQKESVESGTTEKEETDMDVDPKLIKSQITEQSNETPIVSSDIITAQKESAESGATEKEETDMDVDPMLINSEITEQSNETPIVSSDILTAQKESAESGTTEKEETDMDVDPKLMKSQMPETEKSNETPQAAPQVSSGILTAQKDSIERGKTEKDETDMVDDTDLIKSQKTEKSDPNDTNSSATDINTSTYDINNHHGLDRPDVMIDIPTQELIDTFDDGEETFNETYGSTEIDKLSVSNIIDKLDSIEDKNDTENITEAQLIAEKINTEETISNKDKANNVPEKLLTNEVGKSDSKTAIEDASIENIHLDTNTEMEKLEEEAIPVSSSNPETSKLDVENQNTLEGKVSNADIIFEANSELPKNMEPSSSEEQEVEKEVNIAEVNKDKESSVNLDFKEEMSKVAKDIDDAQPSTSNHQELSDEDQEATDSLGLLAESSRVMEDDDEQEQEPEPEDDDDDDDFDQDDESNQMIAEHSEDSNAQHSEAEAPKAMEVDESNDAQPEPDIPETLETETDLGIDENDPDETGDDIADEIHGDGEEDESDEKDEMDIQIGEIVSQTAEEDVTVAKESDEVTDETEKAVADLLQEEKAVEVTDVQAADTVEATADKPREADEAAKTSKLRELLLKEEKNDAKTETPEVEHRSPSKTKKLEISKPKNEINIVELEESSSEDDIQVINKKAEPPASPKDKTSVNIPSEVEVFSAAVGETSDIQEKDGEVRVCGLPKPTPPKPAPKTSESKAPIDFGLEIFSLDSDDEETEVKSTRKSKLTAVELDKAGQTNKCINVNCTSDGSVPLTPASVSAIIYYAANQRGGGLCLYCAKRFEERSEKLVEGVKDLTPFLSMDMCLIREEFVEISDSDSEDEPEIVKADDEVIGEKGAKFLEDQLAGLFNETWKKYNMEERLLSAQAEINVEVSHLEKECKEIDALLNDCQKETDKLRNDLYAAFADDRTELPPITIVDTPNSQWSGLEEGVTLPEPTPAPTTRERQKRRSAPQSEPPAKRQAIPLGYAPLDGEASKPVEAKPEPTGEASAQNDDDNNDISVVKLSVEAAPAGLPPPGVPSRAALRPGATLYAMRNSFGAWTQVRVLEVQPKTAGQFTMCRVRFDPPKSMTKLLPARCLAYDQPPDVRLTIGTRVVALFKDHRVEKKEEGEKKEAYYSGIVAEIPNPVNSFRYLIFFDDGYAQYVQHANTRLVCECAARVWDEVHPFSRQFVRDYLRAYPERPMVRLHAGQSIKTEWDGKWWVSKVLQVDASLVLVYFEGKKDNKTEWIYRGSTRLAPLYLELQAAERTRARPLPRAQAARRYNMPYVEYTRSDETSGKVSPTPMSAMQTQAQIEQEIRRQRAVAKKSTAPASAPAPAPAPAPVARDNVTSRVVFYTPKNAIKPHKMVPHTCGPRCKRTDVLALKDLRTYNPLTKPLLSGWERQTVKYRIPATKAVMYRAPCGRRIRNYEELHRYLQAIDSDMGVDLFDFNPTTHCLAEFLLNKCLISKKVVRSTTGQLVISNKLRNRYLQAIDSDMGVDLFDFNPTTHCLAEFLLNKCLISKKDLSHGKENVPVPCVNYYDSSLPEFCSYNTERTPTAGVPLNLDPDFLCGCDCTDDCADKSKCACWKMTLEGARTIGLDTNEVGYVYKRLPEPLPSGIYECNSRCKCKQTCLNRVAQHPLQLKLQVFKTANRGWGIRALNDVPKGAFLCVYAGNLLTDATANLDGLNEGDEYLAELDYIEVVEQMKEGFEEDIPEDAKKLDDEEEESSELSSSEEEKEKRGDDDDFRPAMPSGQYTPSEYSKRLRKREKSKKAKEKEDKEKKQKEKEGDDCITISDDEELREPAHFSVQTGMKGKEFVSKYKSVRTLFGKDEACYIMDAKVQGNIGRYLNHSCTPNVFVQNVFVDTHDPRFPWVAFFALSQIRAGTELTWNYNYDVGSVPGKVLYCYCNAPNCRGRLL